MFLLAKFVVPKSLQLTYLYLGRKTFTVRFIRLSDQLLVVFYFT